MEKDIYWNSFACKSVSFSNQTIFKIWKFSKKKRIWKHTFYYVGQFRRINKTMSLLNSFIIEQKRFQCKAIKVFQQMEHTPSKSILLSIVTLKSLTGAHSIFSIPFFFLLFRKFISLDWKFMGRFWIMRAKDGCSKNYNSNKK